MKLWGRFYSHITTGHWSVPSADSSEGNSLSNCPRKRKVGVHVPACSDGMTSEFTGHVRAVAIQPQQVLQEFFRCSVMMLQANASLCSVGQPYKSLVLTMRTGHSDLSGA